MCLHHEERMQGGRHADSGEDACSEDLQDSGLWSIELGP